MFRHSFSTRLQTTRSFSWNRFALLPAFAAVLLVTGCETMQSDKAVTAVRAANDAFYDALNAMLKGDMKPMDEIWSHADDVTYMPPTGERLAGWSAVQKNWQKQADAKLGGHANAENVRIVIAAPTVAVVTTTEKGSSPNTPGGPMKVDIRATNVYREESGQWKMIHHHTDRMPKLKAAENAAGP